MEAIKGKGSANVAGQLQCDVGGTAIRGVTGLLFVVIEWAFVEGSSGRTDIRKTNIRLQGEAHESDISPRHLLCCEFVLGAKERLAQDLAREPDTFV